MVAKEEREKEKQKGRKNKKSLSGQNRLCLKLVGFLLLYFQKSETPEILEIYKIYKPQFPFVFYTWHQILKKF